MATQIKTKGGSLYVSDLYARTLEQADMLKAGRLHELDLRHLIEVVEGLAMAEWGAAKSQA